MKKIDSDFNEFISVVVPMGTVRVMLAMTMTL